MKKLSALLFSLVAAANSFAGIYNYIIKDGKLQEGVTVASQFDEDGNPYSTLIEKDGYMELTKSNPYLDCRLDIGPAKAFSLRRKNLVVEYQLPQEFMMYNEEVGQKNISNLKEDSSAVKYKFQKDKPSLIIGATPDTLSAAKFDSCVLFSCVNVDGKFNKAASEGFVKFEGCSYWKTDEKVGSVFLCYFHEVGMNDINGNVLPPIKIKNLYYYEPDGMDRPFFACAFDGNDTWTSTYAISGSDTIYANKKYYPYKNVPTVLGDEFGNYTAIIKMFWHNEAANWTGSDQEGGFLASELYHGLLVKSNASYNDEVLDQNITIAYQDIQLPKNLNDGKIKVSFVTTADPDCKDEIKTGDIKVEYLPIAVKFDNGEEIPMFKDSVIPTVMTSMSETVTGPAGAKNVTVLFKTNPSITYWIDHLVLSAPITSCCGDDGSTYFERPEADSSEFVDTSAIVDVNMDIDRLTIYPNPVINRIDLRNLKNVRSVEVMSMDGVVSYYPLVDGGIDVSDLPSGVYTLVVNKTMTGKFVKRRFDD